MIVFCFKALLFFSYAAMPTPVGHDLNMAVPLPVPEVEAEVKKVDADIKIKIDAKGQMQCGGKVVDGKGLIELLKAKKQDKAKLVVEISADDKAPHQKLIDVLDLVTKAGIEDVTFALSVDK